MLTYKGCFYFLTQHNFLGELILLTLQNSEKSEFVTITKRAYLTAMFLYKCINDKIDYID